MTITTADALDVLQHVAACHRRTAPKMDDREAAIATAGIWAELFNAHRLNRDDLLAAVKLRAQSEAEAPEPAEIITVARKIRRERVMAAPPTADYEALCESKADNAVELAAIRRQRELDPPRPRPQLSAAIAQIAAGKAVAPIDVE